MNDETKNFSEWLTKNWIDAGGLINQATAMRILNKSRPRINQMITEGKLKEYRYEKLSYVSFTQIMNLSKKQ